MYHQILIFLGLTNASGRAYLAWSGFGSDLSELAIIGALIGILRKHNCEVKHCWRIAKHITAANHNVCRKHHPEDSLSAKDVLRAHKRALGNSKSSPPAPRSRFENSGL